jgi:hypothetical protein
MDAPQDINDGIEMLVPAIDKIASMQRRLRHWLDASMMGKPVSFIQDEIALKLADYEHALKKHGVVTLTGTLSEVLDPRYMAATAGVAAGLALGGAEIIAATAAAGLVIGRVVLSITTRLLELDELTQRSEVAVIHELEEKRTAP